MSKKNGFSRADLNTLIEDDSILDEEDFITQIRTIRKHKEADEVTPHKKKNPHKSKKRYADEFED